MSIMQDILTIVTDLYPWADIDFNNRDGEIVSIVMGRARLDLTDDGIEFTDDIGDVNPMYGDARSIAKTLPYAAGPREAFLAGLAAAPDGWDIYPETICDTCADWNANGFIVNVEYDDGTHVIRIDWDGTLMKFTADTAGEAREALDILYEDGLGAMLDFLTGEDALLADAAAIAGIDLEWYGGEVVIPGRDGEVTVRPHATLAGRVNAYTVTTDDGQGEYYTAGQAIAAAIEAA